MPARRGPAAATRTVPVPVGLRPPRPPIRAALFQLPAGAGPGGGAAAGPGGTLSGTVGLRVGLPGPRSGATVTGRAGSDTLTRRLGVASACAGTSGRGGPAGRSRSPWPLPLQPLMKTVAQTGSLNLRTSPPLSEPERPGHVACQWPGAGAEPGCLPAAAAAAGPGCSAESHL
jgi:hypothetical protein